MNKVNILSFFLAFSLYSCNKNYYNYLSETSFLENGWYVFNDFKFKGEIKEGKPNGLGTLIYPNGTTIKGNFIDGVLNGSNSNFNIPILGEIKSEVINGEQVSGEINYNNGNYYQGGLNANQPSGEGILRKSNGDIIAGNFKNGNLVPSKDLSLNNGEIKQVFSESSEGKFDGATYLVTLNSDSAVVTYFDGKKSTYLFYRIVSSNGNPILFENDRNFFNLNNWKKEVILETEKKLETNFTFTFTKEDYLRAK